MTMTEQEWVGGTDPETLLALLGSSGEASARKWRLFACACCRQVWHLLKNESSQRALEGAERLADQLVSSGELESVWEAADEAYWLKVEDGDEAAAAWMALTMLGDLPDALHQAVAPDLDNKDLGQASILRCLFGNPFRLPPPVEPAWLSWNDSIVRRLAEDAYEDRLLPAGHLEPQRLGVLADALEEAGADAELLAHLREPGPHYRGCWCIDLLLAKE
jgi:hypothetical protein